MELSSPPVASSAPNLKHSPPGCFHTSSSTHRGRSRSLRGGSPAPSGRLAGSAPRGVGPPQHSRRRRPDWRAGGEHTVRARRRRCRAAGSNSRHSSRGRTVVPGGRGGADRWHRDRVRSAGVVVGRLQETGRPGADRVRVAVDLLVASRFGGAQFEAIQGAFAGQGLLGLAFAGGEAEEGIVALLVVIVEGFVAEGEAVDALGEQLTDGCWT